MPSGNSPEEAQPWWSRPSGWMPSSCKGLRAHCSLFPDLFALDNRPLFSRWRKVSDLATQKSLQQKASLNSCLDVQQRAEVYGGLMCHSLQASGTPCLLYSHISSRKCRLHLSDKETEKERSQSPGVMQLHCWCTFLLCPKQKEQRWRWIPPHHGGLPDLPSGLLHPRKCPCVIMVTSPSLRGRHRGAMGVIHEDHTLQFGLTLRLEHWPGV